MKSIRARLMLWYVVVVSIILTAFCLVLYLNLEANLYRETDRLVRDKAALAAVWVNPRQSDVTQQIERNFRPDLDHLFVQVLDLDGHIIGGSLNLREALPVNQRLLAEVKIREDVALETIWDRHGNAFRVGLGPHLDEQGKLIGFTQAAVSLSQVSRSVRSVQLWLLIGAPLALAVSVIGGHFLVQTLLRPLAAMSQTAQRISADSLSQHRLPSSADDELGMLARTFNEMLDRLDRAVNTQRSFIADAAHELRSPLTALRGEIEVSLRRPRTREEYEAALKSSLEEIERLSRLTNDLLTLAQADSGESIVHPEAVNVSAICSNVCARLGPFAEAKGVQLTLDASADIYIWADRSGLERVVFNLVENALKYSPQGETVRVCPAADREHATLTVADTGVGIPPQSLPRIFDRFYRVDPARSREPGGSGLGLAIVKTIVAAHGGTAEAASEIGKGSTFTVRLPLHA